MIAIPRRKGFISTSIVEMRREIQRMAPKRAPGILTSSLTGGVVRRPIQRRVKATGGGGAARWA